jgi:hypothetical protein
MKYPLSINWVVDADAQGRLLRSKVNTVMAEANLGDYDEFGFPNSFSGKLVGLTLGQILHFKSAPGVEIGFRGAPYRFEELGMDGAFRLHKGRR